MSSTILLGLLFSGAFAVPLTKRVNQLEHVILANCVDASGIKYSEIAYFPSAVNIGSSTTSTAIINTPFNTNQIWEGKVVSGTFADGDTFTAQVQSVPLGNFAGTGSNAYGGFNCFYDPIPNLYIDSPNSPIPLTCSQVYDCSHNAAPAPIPTVEYFLTSDRAAFDGTGATASDFLSPIFQHFSQSSSTRTSCDNTAVEIPNTGDPLTGAPNCNIVFNCDGDTGTILSQMANTLTQVVATLPDIIKTSTVSITPYCIQPGPIISSPGGDSPSACLQMSGNTKTVSNIVSHLTMDVLNFPVGGNLEFQITCPAPPSCSACDLLSQTLDGPSKIPVVGGLFSGLELLNKASCANSNCQNPL
jgi:hypothetical protein